MRIRTGLSLLLAAAMIGGLIAPSSLAAKKKKKPAGPVVVATDPDNDWGADATIGPAGNLLGQELVEASITMADAETVNFVIKVKSLPATGGIPEFTRYGWDFTVDGEPLHMSGGFTDFVRGVCYPVHSGPGSCPPPKNPGLGAFFVRKGDCTVSADIDCQLVANVNATFDTAAATITIPVPLEALGAKRGSAIGPGVSAQFGSSIHASPAVVVQSGSGPHDAMAATVSFIVP